jgi:NAD(P)-dependent dehydrogenase (short-subunit alcohol dehydrogenase family)
LGNKLEGKIAVITGGNSGIGLATAKRFVSEAAYVSITGRRQNKLDAGISEIGKNVMGVQGNVSNLADIDRLYNTVNDEKGHIDILFANAGVVDFTPLEEITEEHFDKIFDINVKGLLFIVQKALSIFQDDGSITLNASAAAYKGTPAFSVYSASKAAIRSFARTWTVDLKHRKIRVNALSPGPIDTPGIDVFAQNEEHDKQLKRLTTTVPRAEEAILMKLQKLSYFLHRMKAVLLLVSTFALMVVGHNIDNNFHMFFLT